MDLPVRRNWDAEMLRRPAGVIVGRGDYCANYNRWLYRSKERAIQRLLKKHGVDIAGTNVLDVGSGLGYWFHWFRARDAASVTGLDNSTEAVRRLSKRFPNASLFCSDITSDLALGEEFDIVSAIDVLFHLSADDDFERAVRNLASVVKLGGAMVVTDRFGRHTPHSTGRGCWRSTEHYQRVLRPLGLEIASIQPVAMLMNGGLHDTLARPRRLLSRPVHLVEEALAPVLYALDAAAMPRPNLQVMLARRLP